MKSKLQLAFEGENLSIAEWYVLSCCAYGPMPIWGLAGDAEAESRGHAFGPITLEAAYRAISSCLGKELLQKVSEQFVTQIAAELAAANVIGPVYGLPPWTAWISPKGARSYSAR
jgi:hypothetical protein